MTRAGFILRNLMRKKTRFALTLASVVTAFVLFGLLHAVNLMFNAGADFIGATRLITQSRVSFTQGLPLRFVPEIESVPGVERLAWQQWFGGVYGENDQLFTFAVPPGRWRDVYPEWVMPDEQWDAFERTRTGAIVGRVVADRYGWKVGQKLPLASNIFPKKDGSKNWEFDLVGIYDGKDEDWQKQTQMVFIHFDYFDEANQFQTGDAGIYVIKLADPDVAQQVAQTIDARYENSPDETKTLTEKDWNIGFAKQWGDIGLIVRWILFAVFFTLLLVVGNTMAQSVRERVPELAILKTLGFGDGEVTAFVLAEAALICLIGAVIGLSLAVLLAKGVASASGGNFPVGVDWRVWSAGAAAALGLSLAVGVLPALRARRLRIVDALAGR